MGPPNKRAGSPLAEETGGLASAASSSRPGADAATPMLFRRRVSGRSLGRLAAGLGPSSCSVMAAMLS